MIVTLDGQKLDQHGAFRGTLESLVERIRAELPGDQVLVAVSLGGRELVGDELNERLAGDLAADAQIDLESASPREIASAALRESADRLDLAADALSEVAADFQAGKGASATGGLSSLLAVWNTCQQTLGQAGALLNRDLTLEIYEGKSLNEQLGAVVETLRSLRDAVEARDNVLIADLIEYEMPDLCRRWHRILTTTADQIEHAATAAA